MLRRIERCCSMTPFCPPNLTADEEREACRALKGSMLRQEVYALDGTDKAAASLHRHRAELHDPAVAAAGRATATPCSSPMPAKRSATTTSATRPIRAIGSRADAGGGRVRQRPAAPSPSAIRVQTLQSVNRSRTKLHTHTDRLESAAQIVDHLHREPRHRIGCRSRRALTRYRTPPAPASRAPGTS